MNQNPICGAVCPDHGEACPIVRPDSDDTEMAALIGIRMVPYKGHLHSCIRMVDGKPDHHSFEVA